MSDAESGSGHAEGHDDVVAHGGPADTAEESAHDPAVVGHIPLAVPVSPAAPRPLFTRVPGNAGGRPHPALRDAPPDTRPCDHGRFVLDDEWLTVTCGECGERLDPYAVLRRHAVWWEEFAHREARAEEAEKRFHVEELRRLRRLRGTSPEDVAAIDAALGQAWRHSAHDLAALSRRIERGARGP